MSENALSSRGTLIARQPAGTPGVFTTIAELGDITPIGLSRNEFETTDQLSAIDSYALGILRRNPVTISLNWIPTNATHDHLTGMIYSLIHNIKDGYRVTFPDGTIWIQSGSVQSWAPKAPVDGKLSADFTLRMSGPFLINGTIIVPA